jgi:hypothetical protein
MLYTQFPSPPAELNETSALIFIDADFSHPTSFLNWLQQYKVFYDGVSGVHSRINDSVEGISQAYSDSAKLLSEELDQLKKENNTDSWTIQSLGEIMAYDKAMSAYYPSVFRPLDTIFSSGTSAEVCINQYGNYLNQSESYDQQYYAIRSLAFSGILPPVALMAFGVVIPLILLGQANRFEHKLDIRKWRYIYNIMIVFSISFFVIGTIWGSYVIWAQIYSIFP